MRSVVFTLLLVVAALALGGLVGWQLRQGNLDVLFGAPPTQPGQRLYHDFAPHDVKSIRVSGGGVSADFTLTPEGWQASEPWQDRMNPRAAVAIIGFTLGMRVEDLAELSKTDPVQTGLGESAIQIRLEDEDGRPLAKYKLGQRSSWKADSGDENPPATTVFVQPHDKSRKSHVYICSGDILPLFKDGFKFLRDHHPFYFNPVLLQTIRIRGPEGELTLGRETPESPWRIVKPLDLRTDPAAVRILLEGLYQLQAVKVSDREAVTLPTTGNAPGSRQIALRAFGAAEETVLEIHPPDPADARDVLATVTDRPRTVFEIPLRPEPGLISLANLPLSVNELRDPTLTNLNIASIKAISIEPATGTPILISRENPRLWTATINGHTQPANEQRLFELLKTVTESRAIGFESDAATDLSPWGLDRPILRLRFLSQDNQGLELAFGMDSAGGIYANRPGTPTVMRVDPTMLANIASQPHEWRHARLWSISRVDLMAIERTAPPEPTMLMRYDFLDESWRAFVGNKDVSAKLDPARANFLLTAAEGLEVQRWLAPTHPEAAAALASPQLILSFAEKKTDDLGDTIGLQKRELRLAAPVGEANPLFYYGRINTDPHPFMIDREVFSKLALDVMED